MNRPKSSLCHYPFFAIAGSGRLLRYTARLGEIGTKGESVWGALRVGGREGGRQGESSFTFIAACLAEDEEQRRW